MTINMEGYILECSLQGIYIINDIDSEVQNNGITRDILWPIPTLINYLPGINTPPI